MIEYILILTLLADTSQTGQAIDHIGGFRTQQECLHAGNEWLKQVRASESYRTPRALCIEQTHSANGDSNG